MGEYDFQMDYLPTAKKVIADTLSRAAVCSFNSLAADANLTLDNNALRTVQNKDSYCHYILILEVPESMKYELLRAAHIHCYTSSKSTTITLQHMQQHLLVAEYVGGHRPICSKLRRLITSKRPHIFS